MTMIDTRVLAEERAACGALSTAMIALHPSALRDTRTGEIPALRDTEAAYPARSRDRIRAMLHEPRQDMRVTRRGLSRSWAAESAC